MSEIPNISEEYNYFEKLFEKAEKEQVGDLYKKELYIMNEDLENNNSKTKLKLMHDTLLKKLFCEDFIDFTPKNELDKKVNNSPKNERKNIININNKNASKEDLLDKELSEELDYLKTISRLNYLTFSPFALDYFEKINNLSNSTSKNNAKNNENIQNDNDINKINIDKDINNLKENKEKEEKLLGLLDFDYNCFEINNDLLFNICHGFIDPSKLKESNIKIPTEEQLKEVSNKDLSNDSSDSSKNDEYELYEYDEELEQEVIDRTMNFVNKYENDLILKGAIIRFKDELRNLPSKCKNKVKNAFYRKWENEFIKLEKSNERFLKKRKEDNKKKELQKQRKYLNKLKKEKSQEVEQYTGYGNELFDELKKLQKDAKIKSKDSDKEDKNKTRRKKKFNKAVSKEKDELVKSNKKFYCSGFNIYKEILSKRNTSEKK